MKDFAVIPCPFQLHATVQRQKCKKKKDILIDLVIYLFFLNQITKPLRCFNWFQI